MRHLALVAILAVLPAAAAGQWSERRSEPRDQARAQRHPLAPDRPRRPARGLRPFSSVLYELRAGRERLHPPQPRRADIHTS